MSEQQSEPQKTNAIAWVKAVYALCWLALMLLIVAIVVGLVAHVLVRELVFGWRLGA